LYGFWKDFERTDNASSKNGVMKRKKHSLNRFEKLRAAFSLLAGMMALSAQAVVTVAPGEMAQKNQWAQEHLLDSSNLPPFSFTYNGQSSSSLLPTWPRTETDTVLDTNRTQHVITWDGGILEVSCVAVEYNDYPMVEWTVYFKNTGSRSTPLLANIQGLDATFSRTSGSEFVLHGNKGDFATPDSYEPFQTTLGPFTVNNFSPYSYSGKSCDGPNGWPYYNLQMPGGGMIVAIGWPGEWASSFTRDAGNNLRIEAGQQLTHLVLEPGEKIRTPLIALMFWQGTDVVRSQNVWRHWYMAHEIPRVNGQPPSTTLQVQGDSTSIVQAYIAAGIHPDILWRDTGWFPHSDGPYTGAISWLNTGTWEVDPNQYPYGFHRTSLQVNSLGTKFLLWFEPERVGNTNNSFLATNDPSWLLPQTGSTVGDILNEGDPEVYNWLTNHIESLITANGVNWYREDMNGDGPLPTWRNNDASDRQGITENFYVQGHLAYWDALLAMNPGLRIDCCGSGGRRNDLEAMRRAVPLTRSDYNGVSTLQSADGEQCQTYGLSSWLPFQGSGTGLFDPYSFRSFYMASFGFNYLGDQVAANQQGYGECKKIAPIMLNGDYYPLTPYSLADTVWMAWQFDRPDTGEGCVQVFRRTNSVVSSMSFKLQGLETNKLYDVQDFDNGDLGEFTGSALMSNGVTLHLQPRQSAVLYYKSVPLPQIKIGTEPGQVSLIWTNSAASLQSAPAITGPWSDVTGATSPFPIGTSNNQEFFRLRQ
jgi:alpha-galactosidase